MITSEFGCPYLGVDYSASGLEIAGNSPAGSPAGSTRHVSRRCPTTRSRSCFCWRPCWRSPTSAPCGRGGPRAGTGWRFAFTVEEGEPLSPAERDRMPDADTAWPIQLAELTDLLAEVGLAITWQEECTRSHAERRRRSCPPTGTTPHGSSTRRRAWTR